MLILQFEDFTLFLIQILIAKKWQKETGERKNKQQREMICLQQKM